MDLVPFRILFISIITLTLTACGSDKAASGQSLQFLTSNLPSAFIGETYQQNIQISQGTRPYTLKRSKGELPPGLLLSGYTLTGIPTGILEQAKTYTFSLEISDANLSNKIQEFTLNLNPERPTSLDWLIPGTSVKGEQRIPITMKSPRRAKSYQVSIPWPKGAQFLRVEAGAGKPILFTKLNQDILLVHGALTEIINTMKEVTTFYVVLNMPISTKIEGKIGFEVRALGRSIAHQELPNTKLIIVPTKSPSANTTPTEPTSAKPIQPTTTPTEPISTPNAGGSK